MLITTSHLGLLIILISILRASDTNHVSSSFKREPDLIRYKEPDYLPPKPFSFKNLIFKILGLEYDSDTDDDNDDDDDGGGESESSSSDKGPPSLDSELEDIIEKTPPKDLSSSSESDSETDMDIPRYQLGQAHNPPLFLVDSNMLVGTDFATYPVPNLNPAFGPVDYLPPQPQQQPPQYYPNNNNMWGTF